MDMHCGHEVIIYYLIARPEALSTRRPPHSVERFLHKKQHCHTAQQWIASGRGMWFPLDPRSLRWCDALAPR